MDISMDICGKILDISLYPHKDIFGRKKEYFVKGLTNVEHEFHSVQPFQSLMRIQRPAS